MRLQKLLQNCGLGSRREIRQSITAGIYSIDGKIVKDPNFEVDPKSAIVKKNGKKIKIHLDRKVYYIMNKPVGVITSLNDPEGRTSIADYTGKIRERIYPVGRLDYNSEGLVLLTNDGELTNFIISPRNMVPKTYMIKIKGEITREKRAELIKKGFFLEGRRVKFEKIEFVRKTRKGNSWLNLKIIEGKKHVIRKVFKYSGHPVEKLKRMAIGTIRIGKLQPGMIKELSGEEIESFKRRYNFSE